MVGPADLQQPGDEAFWLAAEQRLGTLLQTSEARAVSNIVWAFATRQHILSSRTVHAISVRFQQAAQQAAPQTSLLWGLARLGAPAQGGCSSAA